MSRTGPKQLKAPQVPFGRQNRKPVAAAALDRKPAVGPAASTTTGADVRLPRKRSWGKGAALAAGAGLAAFYALSPSRECSPSTTGPDGQPVPCRSRSGGSHGVYSPSSSSSSQSGVMRSGFGSTGAMHFSGG